MGSKGVPINEQKSQEFSIEKNGGPQSTSLHRRPEEKTGRKSPDLS